MRDELGFVAHAVRVGPEDPDAGPAGIRRVAGFAELASRPVPDDDVLLREAASGDPGGEGQGDLGPRAEGPAADGVDLDADAVVGTEEGGGSGGRRALAGEEGETPGDHPAITVVSGAPEGVHAPAALTTTTRDAAMTCP